MIPRAPDPEFVVRLAPDAEPVGDVLDCLADLLVDLHDLHEREQQEPVEAPAA